MKKTHMLSSAAVTIAGKLAPKFIGPCLVTRKRGVNVYEVEDMSTKSRHVVHVKDLKSAYVQIDV